MIDWTVEMPLIEIEATAKNVDPAFIMAIRECENGASGREFGVLSNNTSMYSDQLRITIETVAHRLEAFPGNPVVRDPFGRIRYSEKWIAYFASFWSPVGITVQNDPNQSNKNWLPNILKLYVTHIAGHF